MGCHPHPIVHVGCHPHHIVPVGYHPHPAWDLGSELTRIKYSDKIQLRRKFLFF